MSILKIARLGHPILYKKALHVDDIKDSGIKKLIHDMSETMLDYKGIGLAAPQIGITKRVCVINVKEPIILINPEIIESDGETMMT